MYNAITGEENSLYPYRKEELNNATNVKFIVSFSYGVVCKVDGEGAKEISH